MAELRGSDLAAVADQLGREPLTDFTVVARCPAGHPLVIRNHPVDRGGKPFPTLFWLTCPDAVKAVSRLEADGWIRRLVSQAERDDELGEELARAHRRYARERARAHAPAGAWGGVAGSERGVKCLHAHYANHLAGGGDPVGGWVAECVEPIHAGTPPAGRVAAVDLGTNSIRLLVADPGRGGRDGFPGAVPGPGGAGGRDVANPYDAGPYDAGPYDADLMDIARDMVITRLGAGVDGSRGFHPDAVERTLDVLGWYARRARALGATRIRLGATSAVRDVADRESLLDRIAELIGEPPEVLTGAREAELTFRGATAGLEAPAPFLVFDIGGGSTELVMGGEAPEASISVDVGSVRITERVDPADPPTAKDLDAMRRAASEALEPAAEAVPAGRAGTMVGVAGTTTTVQAISLGLDRYDPEAIHRTVLTLAEAERVTERLASMTVAERAALPVMAPGREDVILAGALILLEILRRWGFRECLVSERDILDGLALEILG